MKNRNIRLLALLIILTLGSFATTSVKADVTISLQCSDGTQTANFTGVDNTIDNTKQLQGITKCGYPYASIDPDSIPAVVGCHSGDGLNSIGCIQNWLKQHPVQVTTTSSSPPNPGSTPYPCPDYGNDTVASVNRSLCEDYWKNHTPPSHVSPSPVISPSPSVIPKLTIPQKVENIVNKITPVLKVASSSTTPSAKLIQKVISTPNSQGAGMIINRVKEFLVNIWGSLFRK